MFPSEITRVRKFLFSYLDSTPKKLNRAPGDLGHQHHLDGADGSTDGQDQVPAGTEISVRLGTPLAWAHSSVSTFGVRYSPPIQDMPLWHSVEALIEGSDMSMLREGLSGLISACSSVDPNIRCSLLDIPMTPDYAWAHREGRNTRYDNNRVGGTVCVHFIKKNMWYLETALAFLEMQDTTELEMIYSSGSDKEALSLGLPSQDSKKSSFRSGSHSGNSDNPNPTTVVAETDLVDPDTKEGHDAPALPTEGVHDLFDQSDHDDSPIRVEGGGVRGGDSVIDPGDELEASQGTSGDPRKRGSNSDPPEERTDQVVAPPTGHFANGSRRVSNR